MGSSGQRVARGRLDGGPAASSEPHPAFVPYVWRTPGWTSWAVTSAATPPGWARSGWLAAHVAMATRRGMPSGASMEGRPAQAVQNHSRKRRRCPRGTLPQRLPHTLTRQGKGDTCTSKGAQSHITDTVPARKGRAGTRRRTYHKAPTNQAAAGKNHKAQLER